MVYSSSRLRNSVVSSATSPLFVIKKTGILLSWRIRPNQSELIILKSTIQLTRRWIFNLRVPLGIRLSQDATSTKQDSVSSSEIAEANTSLGLALCSATTFRTSMLKTFLRETTKYLFLSTAKIRQEFALTLSFKPMLINNCFVWKNQRTELAKKVLLPVALSISTARADSNQLTTSQRRRRRKRALHSLRRIPRNPLLLRLNQLIIKRRQMTRTRRSQSKLMQRSRLLWWNPSMVLLRQSLSLDE